MSNPTIDERLQVIQDILLTIERDLPARDNPKVTTMSCSDCRFYVGREDVPIMGPECHRYPTPMSTPDPPWCGEWKPRRPRRDG